jgi:hypothetical protein
MRIDFAARYREVADLLKVSTKSSGSTSDVAFERDLGSLVLQPNENQEVKAKKEVLHQHSYGPKQSLPNPLDDIRASFKFPEPELSMTPLEPMTPNVGVSKTETQPVTPVKTPTVLEVRRVELPPAGNAVNGIPQLDKEAIRSKLVSAANKAGLDPLLTQAVVNAESSFNVRAVSSDGHASKGLFQLLDSTGRTLMSRVDTGGERYDPFNPDLNIRLGTSYLRYLHDIFKTKTDLPNNLQTKPAADERSLEKLAVAAFNAGEGRVASAQMRSEKAGKDPGYYEQVAPYLPRSTREYVGKVVSGKKLF